MRLLKRKPRTFEIQVQDMTLHIQAATDVDEATVAATEAAAAVVVAEEEAPLVPVATVAGVEPPAQ